MLDEAAADAVDGPARDEVEAAFAAALAATRPDADDAFTDVYADAREVADDHRCADGPDGSEHVGGRRTRSMREALNLALAEALAADPSVLLIGEDLADPGGGISQVTKGLSTRFGTDRVRDTPISEAAIVGRGGRAPRSPASDRWPRS